MCEWERNETELREQVELVGRAYGCPGALHGAQALLWSAVHIAQLKTVFCIMKFQKFLNGYKNQYKDCWHH